MYQNFIIYEQFWSHYLQKHILKGLLSNLSCQAECTITAILLQKTALKGYEKAVYWGKSDSAVAAGLLI